VMDCHDLDSLLEAVADGTLELSPAHHAHLASCASCTDGLRAARAIHAALVSRAVPVPPPGLTAAVMVQVRHDRWRSEQAVDMVFNLAMAAGVLLLLGGGVGLAGSAGLLSVDPEWRQVLNTAATQWSARLVPQLRTVAMSALLVTLTLGAWWWAEHDAAV